MRPIYNNDLPNGWEQRELRRLTIRKRGHTWQKEQESEKESHDTVPVIRIPNIGERLDLADLLHLRGVSEEALKESAVSKDWILFVGSNGNPDRIGDSALMEENRKMVFASFLMGITSNCPTELSPEFLSLWLKVHNVHEIFSKTSQQTTGLANFCWGAVKKLPVRFPKNAAEQQAVVDLIRTANQAVDAAQQKITAAQRLKTALMQQLFTRGIPGRHTQFKRTKVGEIPNEWETPKLKKCGTFGSGGTPDRENKGFYGGHVLWVKSGEVDYRFINDTEEKLSEAGAASINGELLPTGTLLIAMYGAGVTRGRVALLGCPAQINQAIASFNGDSFTDNRWLYYWFTRNYDVVRAFAGGSNQDNLNLYLLKNLVLVRPKLDEQLEIVSLLKSADDNIAACERELEAIKRLKRSLLQNLLTGKVRVKMEN